jgi:hypothetical protein
MNQTPADQAATEAIQRVSAANADWIAEHIGRVRDLARDHDTLTTDDVWPLVSNPSEPRAMGALMVAAGREGFIEATPTTVKSERVECHARPIRVWRSLVRATP